MTTRINYFLVGFAALCLLLAAGLAVQNRSLRSSLNSAEIKSQHLDDHCRALRTALDVEEAEATGSDATQREHHYNKIFELLTSPAVGLRGCSATAVDESKLAVCWANHDYGCLDSITKAAIGALPH